MMLGASYEVQYVDQVAEGNEVWAVYDGQCETYEEACKTAEKKTLKDGCKTAVVLVTRILRATCYPHEILKGEAFLESNEDGEPSTERL